MLTTEVPIVRRVILREMRFALCAVAAPLALVQELGHRPATDCLQKWLPNVDRLAPGRTVAGKMYPIKM